VIHDNKRPDDSWIQDDGIEYGEWDASFSGTEDEYPAISMKQLQFEEFEGWNK